MALDSIAKLSVLITGDESPLAQSTKRAEGYVQQFSRTVDTAYAKMVTKNLFKAAAGAFAHGTVKGMDSFFGAERRLDAVAERFNKLREEMGRMDIPAAKIESVAAKFDLLWQNAADGFAAVASRMGPLLDKLNSMFDGKAGVQGMRAMRAEAEAQEKSMDALEAKFAAREKRRADLAREAAAAIDEINDRHRSAFEAMQSRAEGLRKSMLTPLQAFRETMDEIGEMLRLRLIDTETFTRAAAQAQEQLDKAGRVRQDTMRQALAPIAVAERYTAAGYSAGLPQQDDKSVEKQQLVAEQKQVELMQQIHNVLQARPDMPAFQMSRLN